MKPYYRSLIILWLAVSAFTQAGVPTKAIVPFLLSQLQTEFKTSCILLTPEQRKKLTLASAVQFSEVFDCESKTVLITYEDAGLQGIRYLSISSKKNSKTDGHITLKEALGLQTLFHNFIKSKLNLSCTEVENSMKQLHTYACGREDSTKSFRYSEERISKWPADTMTGPSDAVTFYFKPDY